MKKLLACVVAAGSVLAAGAGLGAANEANAQVAVVVKPNRGKVVVRAGYPYYYNGVHYRYRYSGRYYNRRAWKCHYNPRHHRRVCAYRYY